MNDGVALTIRQVADPRQVAERTVSTLAWARELPGVQVGATWRFEKEAIDRWIETRTRRARSSPVR